MNILLFTPGHLVKSLIHSQMCNTTAESRQRNCVNESDFYREVEELKCHLNMIFTTRPNITKSNIVY